MSSNQQKSDQLGIPYATACNRLRKTILFDLAKRCDLLTCFACGEEIESLIDLSIEHKIPWENRDPNLFWDLDNIAFSHCRCNRPHTYRGRFSRRVNDEGKWWCKGCEEHLDVEMFSLDVKGDNSTPRLWCKKCRSERKKSGQVF